MNNLTPPKKAVGAALVVGLILLVVLSLMAISSMDSASLDLIMTGNEQYHTRAFVAAEAGIEDAWNKGTFDPLHDSALITGTATDSDQYEYQITRPENGTVDNSPLPGNSVGKYGTIYFKITSTGTSARNSTAVAKQEIAMVVNSDYDHSCDQSLTTCALD